MMVQRKRHDEIAILIPAYNEATCISSIVEKCQRWASMVLVVDDGSNDDTARCAQQAGGVVVSNHVRSGVGAALRLGLRELLSAGFRTVVTLDGDGVHDPDEIGELLATHFQYSPDLTIGSRFLSSRFHDSIPTPKIAANLFATAIINQFLQTNLHDAASGMRVLGERAMSLPQTSSTFGFVYETLVTAVAAGPRILEQPIRVRYNAERLLATGVRELTEFLQFVLSCNPQPALRTVLSSILSRVTVFEKVRLIVEGRYLLLYPLPHEQAYLFQFQSKFFAESCVEGDRATWLTLPS
jgi:glycosyltransferase involved in cell wall biosynthesis